MPILLVPYDPEWPELFERAKRELEAVVGRDAFVGLEHVGSTAVPGLVAKPIVDIVAAVADLAAVEALEPRLAKLGYRAGLIPPVPGGASFARHGDGDAASATEHLHIVEADGPKWSALIRFRDRLRADPRDRGDYEQLKRRLAAEHDDTRTYSEAKTDFVERILSSC